MKLSPDDGTVGAKSFKQIFEEAAANDDDPLLDFEREEAFHTWFYDELAKCDRGEEAQVRRWVAEPRPPSTKMSFLQLSNELEKWGRGEQDAAPPVEMRVPTSLRPTGKGSIDVFELLVPQWVPPAAKANKPGREGQAANGPSTGNTASVPFMITAAQKQQLADLGYSEADIFEMKPEEAQRILAGALPKQEKPKQENVPLEFLQALRPQGPWVLTAIDPHTEAIKTSTVNTADEADTFIGKYNGKRNLYYSVNPTRTAMSKKAAKTDVAAIEYALADLDPNKGEAPDAAKARYLGQLNDAFEPKPGAVVDSGNGIQCLWRLRDCIALGEPVNGKFSSEDQDKIDDVEARIKTLMLRLGSKVGTQNIDRILRLPGTINLPNEVKRKDGRVPCPTKLLWFNGAAYPLEAFPKPTVEEHDEDEPAGGKSDDEPEKLSDEAYQELLEHGTIDGERSEAFHRLVWHLTAQGKTLHDIIALLRQYPKGIAAKYLTPTDRLQAEAKRSFDKCIKHVPAVIAKWNKNHAHVLAGSKSCVLQEFKTPERYTDFKLLSSASFREWNAEYVMQVGDEVIPQTKFWLRHPQRRKYQDIGFFPKRDVPGFYNLWRGFAVEPRKGDCSKFLAHLHDNICQGDDELFAWVKAWFADIVQRPEVKCGTSLSFRGKQGVGKTKVGEVFESLLGVHYKLVSDPRYVTGRFNSHMISLLLLFADEGFWAGDKKAEGKLKDLVTGKKHPIEFKGKEAFWVDNYVRLLVSGNEDWVVPAAFEERRFATLDVGDKHREDYAYFAAIDKEMNEGGREALLHHLLFEVDCSKVNLRKIPHTAALTDQKLQSANPEQSWWLDVLRNGTLPGDWDGVGSAPSELLFNDYIEHAKKRGVSRRAIETQVGMFLTKIVGTELRRNREVFVGPESPNINTYRETKRGFVYHFPSLEHCRNLFAQMLGEEIKWDDEDNKWSPANLNRWSKEEIDSGKYKDHLKRFEEEKVAEQAKATGAVKIQVIRSCSHEVTCLKCGKPGDVKRIKNTAKPGSKSETLHETCAARWFAKRDFKCDA